MADEADNQPSDLKKIPFREGDPPPAGNYILAQVENENGEDGGLWWIDPTRIKQGTIKHEAVDGLLPAIRWTWRHLRQYATWCRSLEDWELGFMRDSTPATEVAAWVRATYAFLAFVHKNPTADKSALFSAVVNLMNGRDDLARPKYVEKRLKRLMEDLPRVLKDMKNFTEDGHLKAEEKYLR